MGFQHFGSSDALLEFKICLEKCWAESCSSDILTSFHNTSLMAKEIKQKQRMEAWLIDKFTKTVLTIKNRKETLKLTFLYSNKINRFLMEPKN